MILNYQNKKIMNKDKLTTCRRCRSEFCYFITEGIIDIYSCMSCGYTTNSKLEQGGEFYMEQMSLLPELYKDISYVDEYNLVWIPMFVKQPGKGLVYISGTSANDCGWVGIKEVPVSEDEKEKFKIPNKPGQYYEYKTDFTTEKKFGKLGFLQALNYISNVGDYQKNDPNI